MAVLTFGEGYHNFHHEFQADYRNGIKWYHWDPTKWWIKSLSLVGLAKKLRQVSATEILRVRMAMDERRMLAKGACAEKISSMRVMIEEKQLRFKHLHDEYKNAKKTLKAQSIERYRLLKEEMRVAQLEFKMAYEQWLLYGRSLQVAHI